jgi:hypothetical protein
MSTVSQLEHEFVDRSRPGGQHSQSDSVSRFNVGNLRQAFESILIQLQIEFHSKSRNKVHRQAGEPGTIYLYNQIAWNPPVGYEIGDALGPDQRTGWFGAPRH